MPVHAFIDESGRGRRYFVCVVVIDPVNLAAARKRLAALRLPGQRELHFKTEKPPRRRFLADRIAELPVTSIIYETGCSPRTGERDRQRCLEHAVSDLIDIGADRVVLDSRDEQDKHDRATIYQTLGRKKAELRHEHLNSASVPLLWIPDAVGWCYGAGGDWRQRITPIVAKVIPA